MLALAFIFGAIIGGSLAIVLFSCLVVASDEDDIRGEL